MIIKINIIGRKIFTGIENRSSIWGECRSAGLNLGINNDDRRGTYERSHTGIRYPEQACSSDKKFGETRGWSIQRMHQACKVKDVPPDMLFSTMMPCERLVGRPQKAMIASVRSSLSEVAFGPGRQSSCRRQEC